MSIREGVRTSRRYQLRLPSALAGELERYAQSSGLALGAAIRHLVASGLERTQDEERAGTDLLALAALAASEHTLRLLEQFVPQGERRSAELRQAALVAAEARLEELRRQLEEKA
jgi:hypothetical protein